MFITFKKWSALYLLVLLVLFAGFAAILWRGSAINASKNLVLEQAGKAVLVIDPGHGGMDGGAVAADGTVEAGINLAVGLQMEALSELLGREVLLTRREDVSLHDEAAGSVRQKKVSDLKNRAGLANSVPGAVLVSIHQNSLPSSVVTHGAQVFWNRQEGARELASLVQDSLNRYVNAGNEKIPKQIQPTIYLMKHVTAPGIIVECGFLSNREETELLQDPEHQTRLAAAIAAGYLRCAAGEEVP